MEDDVALGAVGSLASFVADDPQPTSSSPDATHATIGRATIVKVPPPNRPGNRRTGTGTVAFVPTDL
jgi:hypothetical protein